MKFNFKGIRFNTWLTFFGFSLSILLLLGILLVSFIKPYYRNSQLNSIDTIVSTIEDRLINKNVSDSDVEETSRVVIGSNACALIYNGDGKKVYEKNALGELCLLNENVTINNEEINASKDSEAVIDLLNESDIQVESTANTSGYEVLVYGKKIKSNLSDYFLIINVPLEPVESYIDFIMNQYIYIALILMVIAIAVAVILANRISNPIVNMKEEALKLADGDYNVEFKTDSFSEINDLANTLDNATDKLSKVDELRKDLVANVSHDIKTPLTVIKSYAEMIKDISGDDPDKRNEHLDVIIQETEYLNKLVSDMQVYSKMQAGYIELKKSNFDMKECIEAVIALLDQVAKERNIRINKDLKEVVVYADQLKISQVIYNFLSNAIKHSGDDSAIDVRMIDSENRLRVEISDYGDGIAKENIPYIWDRYYKIDKGFSRKIESTGLGLAIAKAILEGHKAKYGVESEVDKGSTFYFELSKDYDEE